MDLSVVIPARNEEHRLGAQLDALLEQEWDGDWEIIVVDNGSTDGTAALVERYAQRSSRVRLEHARERADKSYALNLAIEASGGRDLAFCDADDVVAPGWLPAIAAALRTHEVVTGPNELDRLNPGWLADSRGRSDEAPVGGFGGLFPTIRGNNWGLQRSTWQSMGGMREQYHPLEDAEFSLRCWLEGIEIIGVPDAVVHYRYRDDARSLWRQGFAYGSHRPMIAKLLKQHGKPTPPRFAGWKSWITLVVRVPTVVTRTGRARWLWIAGNRFGQVVGSVRHRTLML